MQAYFTNLSGVPLINAFRCEGRPRVPAPRSVKLSALGIVLAVLSGCGGMGKPQIGPIQFTDASGASVTAISSLAVNGQVFLVGDVTSDDQFLGVSWTVTCGSAAPPGGPSIDNSCGTFNPTETMSGPVPQYPTKGIITTYTAPTAIPKGGTVTITAHVTALPSITSSVMVTIVAGQGEPKLVE
jgi:hypothetical protein